MYRELMKKIREKNIPQEEIDEKICWAMEILERSNPSAYREFIDKLEGMAYSITKAEAETIVRAMRPKGQMWSYDQVKELINSKGIMEGCVDWYLVMNMCYNDYYNTAKTYGLQNDVNFYFNLAQDFITDMDAGKHKVARYFSH